MNISSFGHSCFKLTTKYEGKELAVITDPYDKSIGLRVPKMSADIVTVSHDHKDHSNSASVAGNLENTPFVINQPGEYEIKKVFIAGFNSWHDNKEGAERGSNIIYRYDIEGVTVAHLGDLGCQLTEDQLDQLGDIDVLFIPVGGTYTLDAVGAAKVVREIDPRIVIPMHYREENLNYDLDSVNAFRKEMGGAAETEKKLKISKKSLPSDEIKIIILEK
jgi:L-ascorbate metabolism protein UlaG (beta-lactamase superfamily)